MIGLPTMELREFAERILFATTLAEKLHDPGPITDEHPGPAIATPESPGRPTDLRFKPRGAGKSDFPGLHQLESEHERGRLLHFFGNHELLATELMALVLLRFPDAPPAFRRGVYQTLRDEQEHTRLYVGRMRDCGIAFGQFPVSGFFWRAVSGMENPMDYVAGLSLTFEQANLDYARHFAAAFRTVDDLPSATLLDRIYRDEIAHVAYGLKWFRRWKNPNESDWAAFCRQLRFPLSPQRAKGFSINADGRRAAGLDPDFIAELEVYSQSKGRTPNVYLFNPFAEGYLAQGPGFTPVKHQAALARDLANLPQFLGRQDDLVLVPRRPRVQFLAELKHAGFDLPEFLEPQSPSESPNPNLRYLPPKDRKLGHLRPWAWGPDSLEILTPFFPASADTLPAPTSAHAQDLGRLYSKAWSADLLRRFLTAETEPQDWLAPLDTVGTPAHSLEETLAHIEAIRARGHHRVVVKECLGLAGSNALRLWEPEILETQRRWLDRATQDHREVIVEPWLERVFDFSIQLEASATNLDVVGYTGLVTDARGQFLANTAAPDFGHRLPPPVLGSLRASAPGSAIGSSLPRVLPELHERLLRHLAAALTSANYRGPVGIDAFVYRDAQGRYRLKPIVEINPRYTMGRLTVELMRHACPGTHGCLRLVSRSEIERLGFSRFAEFAAQRLATPALRLEGSPVPRIREGNVCLNDPEAAEACLAIFQVTSAR